MVEEKKWNYEYEKCDIWGSGRVFIMIFRVLSVISDIEYVYL